MVSTGGVCRKNRGEPERQVHRDVPVSRCAAVFAERATGRWRNNLVYRRSSKTLESEKKVPKARRNLNRTEPCNPIRRLELASANSSFSRCGRGDHQASMSNATRIILKRVLTSFLSYLTGTQKSPNCPRYAPRGNFTPSDGTIHGKNRSSQY